MKKNHWLIYTGAVLAISGAFAQNYKGADEVLTELAKIANIKPESKKETNAASLLLEELKAFQTEVVKLSPDEAASRWLAFYDAYLAIPQEVLYQQRQGNADSYLSFASLIESLPPSAAWDALLNKVNARTEAAETLSNRGLQLLVTVIAGTPDSRKSSLEGLEKSFDQLRGPRANMKQHLKQMLQYVEQEVIMRGGSAEDKIALLEETLTRYEKSDENNSRYSRSIAIPDLVTLVGEEKAKALLVRVLKAGLTMTFENKQTQQLAADLALKNLDAMTRPNWALVTDTDHVELFEAMRKKFPDQTDSDWQYRTAEYVYWLSLIINGRIEEATKLTEQSYAEGVESGYTGVNHLEFLQQKGYGKQVLAFVKDILTRKPDLDLWGFYIELSAHQSASPEALEFLETTLKKEDLSAKVRKEIQSYYYAALLAADKIDEGVAVMQALIKEGTAGEGTKKPESAASIVLKQFEKLGIPFSQQDAEDSSGDRLENISSLQSLCVELMQIGHLLEKPELFEEGLTALKTAYGKLNVREKAQMDFPEEAIILLLKKNRGPEAETLLLEVLADQVKGRDTENGGAGFNSVNTQGNLAALAWLYQKAERPADVIKLLDESPMWNAPDLIYVSASPPEGSLNVIVASSLVSLGQKDLAEEFINYLLKQSPGNDRVYELLFSLGGDQIEKRLTAAFERDPFQERPLIWKAKLQLDQGRVDEAEKTIKAAIAIDPSDGEQGKNDRMRAYSILADVLEKKGDNEQAEIMRGAVKAIRLSEDADDWWEAGMLSHAVELYEKSLHHFADAYCIQSRLALRYSELGEFEKAETHYRRAYELMPESFGRIESHCFGCEGAFRGERAQNIADKVFTRLAEEQPDKAQVFYLLGYLRESQQRAEEAADYYRKAVKLDPDYLNAWNKLRALANKVSMSSEERDEITVQLFRLDPRGHHSSQRFDHMTNLRKLWDMLLAADAKEDTDKPVTSLYELKASKKELLSHASEDEVMQQYSSSSSMSETNPRSNFPSHSVVRSVSSFLENIQRIQP